MLTGRAWSDVHTVEIDSPALEGVPAALAEVVLRSTRYTPEERYQTAAEMGRALAEAHSTLRAQRPQEEPTIIMGDEDDDWVVLEQRRDFSEMQEPQTKSSRSSPTTALGAVSGVERRDRRWLALVLLLCGVAALVRLLVG
jgi:hypothetical protein